MILGYDLDAHASRLIINPEEAVQVRSIFEWHLAGETITSIASKARKLGWRNKQWITKEGNQYGGHPLRRTHLYNLLANVLYAGRISVGDEIVRAEHEAIIDPDTFDLVQAKLKETSWERGSQRRVKMDALLRGILYCSCCSAPMYSTYSSSRERRYRYYICSKAQAGESCTSRSVSAPAVEEAVVEGIRRVGIHPEVFAETALVARQQIFASLEKIRGELTAISPRFKNLQSQIARTRNQDDPRLGSIREQLATSEAHAEDLRQKIARLEKCRIDDKDLGKVLRSFDELWESMAMAELRALVRFLVEKVGYDGRSGKITIRFVSATVKELLQRGASR